MKILVRYGARCTAALACALLAFSALHAEPTGVESLNDDVIEGYTTPFRSIQLAAAEPGLLTEVAIQEGEAVTHSTVIARLNHKVLLESLAVAEKEMNATGQLRSVQAELRLREERLSRLKGLRSRGHASPDEIETAQSERDVMQARVQAAEELIAIKKQEYKRIQAQLDRRFVRAPFDGIATIVHKEVGEFVPANDPTVVTLVQLNPLTAVFSVRPEQARKLQKDGSVQVTFAEQKATVRGKVSFISPVNDAESGGVTIKVDVPNDTGRFRSGSKVALHLSPPREQIGDSDLPEIRPGATVKR